MLAQQVKAPCYKPEGRGFETQWGELIFLIHLIFLAALGPGVHLASNRKEYQKQKNNISVKQSTAGAYGCQPYVSHFFRQCGILNISQPYRPLRPLTEINILFSYSRCSSSGILNCSWSLLKKSDRDIKSFQAPSSFTFLSKIYCSRFHCSIVK
jgi:hypothetical protein